MESIEERFVRQLLERDGFAVNRLPESPPQKRADYRAERPGETYLIEVKRVDEEPRMLDADGVGFWEVPLVRRNALAGVARDAARQLVATPAPEAPFRIVWFVTSGMDADSYAEQVLATLYGAVDVVFTMDSQGAKAKRCFFFDFSEFFRRPELDAAVVGSAHHGQLCLNPASPRAEEMRRSHLRKVFGAGVVDPDAEEKDGRAFSADFPGDRRNEAFMLQELCKKYGYERLIPFRPTRYSGAAMARS